MAKTQHDLLEESSHNMVDIQSPLNWNSHNQGTIYKQERIISYDIQKRKKKQFQTIYKQEKYNLQQYSNSKKKKPGIGGSDGQSA